jgi:hypothetical protein
MKTMLSWLGITASVTAAIFWALSAIQPLTLTLDVMQTELQSAAWYNKWAAFSACIAAASQATAWFLSLWAAPQRG